MSWCHQALEQGDAVCLFPEGMSRYQPALSPLKTGVARIISEVLTRRREDPDFEITLLTCSITYMCVLFVCHHGLESSSCHGLKAPAILSF